MERVFLIGYMGCGKSTIGRYIAKDMGWRFIDMDDYVEKQIGCSISQFFADKGEDEFRKAEAQALKNLASEHNAIIATGGGAPCHFDNIDVMRAAGLTIYIKVEPQVLAARLKDAKNQRPLLAGKSDDELLDFISSQLKNREPFYSKAEMSVDGDRLPFSAYKPFIETFALMKE